MKYANPVRIERLIDDRRPRIRYRYLTADEFVAGLLSRDSGARPFDGDTDRTTRQAAPREDEAPSREG